MIPERSRPDDPSSETFASPKERLPPPPLLEEGGEMRKERRCFFSSCSIKKKKVTTSCKGVGEGFLSSSFLEESYSRLFLGRFLGKEAKH